MLRKVVFLGVVLFVGLKSLSAQIEVIGGSRANTAVIPFLSVWAECF